MAWARAVAEGKRGGREQAPATRLPRVICIGNLFYWCKYGARKEGARKEREYGSQKSDKRVVRLSVTLNEEDHAELSKLAAKLDMSTAPG